MFFGHKRKTVELPATAGISPALPASVDSTTQELILMFDLGGKCVYSTIAAAELFGLARGAAAGKTVEELGIKDSVGDSFRADLGRVFLTGATQFGGVWLPSSSGFRYFEYTLMPVIPSRQGVEFVCVNLEDKTRTRRAEEALRLSEERFAKLFRLSPGLMLLREADSGKIVEVNEAWLAATGLTREELVGKTFAELSGSGYEGWQGELEVELQQGGEMHNRFFHYRSKTGEQHSALVSAEKVVVNGREHILSVAQDITEREKLSKEIGRFERLNLVGQMAAGLGHEVRNPMTTIRGFLQMLSEKIEYQKDREFFDLMIEELDRANGIITEFLQLARDKAADFKRQDLNEVIGHLVPLLAADAMLAGKEVITELAAVPLLWFDEKEIRQLVLNLARNGLEAMPAGGKLTLSTGQVPEGTVLAVRDNGPGIAPELLDKLGTPFFTTKDNGTGLGLATCYSIASRHRAKLKITSDSGGTVVSVVFPPAETWGEGKETAPSGGSGRGEPEALR